MGRFLVQVNQSASKNSIEKYEQKVTGFTNANKIKPESKKNEDSEESENMPKITKKQKFKVPEKDFSKDSPSTAESKPIQKLPKQVEIEHRFIVPASKPLPIFGSKTSLEEEKTATPPQKDTISPAKNKTKLDAFLEEMLNEAETIMAVPDTKDAKKLSQDSVTSKRSKMDSLVEAEFQKEDPLLTLDISNPRTFENPTFTSPSSDPKLKNININMARLTKFTDIKITLTDDPGKCVLPLTYSTRVQYAQLFIEGMIREMLMALKGEIKRLTKVSGGPNSGGGSNSPRNSDSAPQPAAPSQQLINKLVKANIMVKCHRITASDTPFMQSGGDASDLNEYYMKFVDAMPDSIRKSMMIDDIWVLIDCKKASEAVQKIMNPDAMKELILCKANWHSISGQNVMSISFLSKPGAKSRFLKSVYAINLMNVSTYVQVIENLVAFYKSPQDKHVYARINNLLHIDEKEEDDLPKRIPVVKGIVKDKVLDKAAKICEEFALNEDQRAVIFQCAKWFYDFPDESDSHNTVLVHGAFGCGILDKYFKK